MCVLDLTGVQTSVLGKNPVHLLTLRRQAPMGKTLIFPHEMLGWPAAGSSAVEAVAGCSSDERGLQKETPSTAETRRCRHPPVCLLMHGGASKTASPKPSTQRKRVEVRAQIPALRIKK